MARNQSEKGPRVIAARMVTPALCEPSRLVLKRDSNGTYWVWIGCGTDESYVLEARDQDEAREVYDWFADNFYFVKMPNWEHDRWTMVDDDAA